MPRLYVVATPIGNLDDLTPRMRWALESASLIAAEDTRVTQKLLTVMGISRPLISIISITKNAPAHNRAHDRGKHRRGRDVRRRYARHIRPRHGVGFCGVAGGRRGHSVSGPSAVITTLSAAGFDAREFAFYGFLPRENGDLRKEAARDCARPARGGCL